MQTKKMAMAVLIFLSAAGAKAQMAYQQTVINEKPAMPNFQVSVSPSKSTTGFVLRVENPGNRKLHLRISHLSGLLVDTVVQSETFQRVYNMEQADEGNYTLKVNCGKEKIVKTLELYSELKRNVVIR